jgi:hypothetical protein
MESSTSRDGASTPRPQPARELGIVVFRTLAAAPSSMMRVKLTTPRCIGITMKLFFPPAETGPMCLIWGLLVRRLRIGRADNAS